MKNFWISFLLILFLLSSNMCCYSKQSLNTFRINIQDVPQQMPQKDDGGLSDGVITAIALGSVFGGLGVLSGVGYYFYKNSKGLQAGCTCGQKCPYQTIDSKTYQEILTDKKRYTYLMKASEKSVINSNYRYLIIPDTEIKHRIFNTVFFELPKTNNTNINACNGCINTLTINSFIHAVKACALLSCTLSIEYVIVINGAISIKKPVAINLFMYIKKNFN